MSNRREMGDVTSFNGREGKYLVATVMAWDTADKDDEVRRIVDATTKVFKAREERLSDGAESHYNYLSEFPPSRRLWSNEY